MKSLYEILGVAKDATQDLIKQSYRKKAQKLHPDKPTGSETEFKELAEAYAILSDQTRRLQYDRTGKVEKKQDPQEYARNCITTTLLSLIDRRDIDHDDLIELTRKNIQGYIQGVKENKVQIENAIKKIKNVLSRLTTPDGIVDDAIKSRSDQFQAQLEQMDDDIEIHSNVLVVLSGYKYKVDDNREAKRQLNAMQAMTEIMQSNAHWQGFHQGLGGQQR